MNPELKSILPFRSGKAIPAILSEKFIGLERFYFNDQQTILGNGTASVITPIFHIDPGMTTLVFTAADFLLIIGMSLIIGRNTRVLKYYYQQKKRTKETWP